MERLDSFHKKVLNEALWLWATLAAGIALGTGVTALLYALGTAESSALTVGFVAMVVLLVGSEAWYRRRWRGSELLGQSGDRPNGVMLAGLELRGLRGTRLDAYGELCFRGGRGASKEKLDQLRRVYQLCTEMNRELQQLADAAALMFQIEPESPESFVARLRDRLLEQQRTLERSEGLLRSALEALRELESPKA